MSVMPYLPKFENLRASTPMEPSLLTHIAALESQVQSLLAFQQRVIQGMPAFPLANIPEPCRQSNLMEPVIPTPQERFVFPGFEDLASSPPSRTMPLDSPVARQQADNTEQGPAMAYVVFFPFVDLVQSPQMFCQLYQDWQPLQWISPLYMGPPVLKIAHL